MSQSNHLISHLVKTYYGEGYCWVVERLLDSKELQLPDLAKSAPTTSHQLRSLLVVLVKNDIVETLSKTVAGQPCVFYRLNVEACLALPLYPRLLGLIEERFSFLGKSIAETLLLNGKMSAKDCIEWTRENIELELENFQLSNPSDAELREIDYLQELSGLLAAHLVVPVHKLVGQTGQETGPGVSLGDTFSKSELPLT